MKNSIKMIVAGVTATILLNGCGGGGSSLPPVIDLNETEKNLSVTVNDTTVDSTSSLSRVTIITSAEDAVVAKISMSKKGEITLSGGADKDKFELKAGSSATEKKLSFKQKPNPYKPTDSDNDGVYEVDIKAQSGEEVLVYKAAFKIPIPTSAEKLLSGKTLYVQYGENNYTKYIFSQNSSVSLTSHFYDAVSDSLVDTDSESVDITYIDNNFSYDFQGNSVVCTIKDEASLTFTCKYQNITKDVKFLTQEPPFVKPKSYTVTVLKGSANVSNYPDTFAPKIASFSVTGNKASENGKAVIYKSRFNGSFSYTVKYEDGIYAQLLGVQLVGGNYSINTTKNLFPGSESKSNCKFDRVGPNGEGVQYTCNNIVIDNESGSLDTSFEAYICDNTDTSSSSVKCSVARVPVLFVDE